MKSTIINSSKNEFRLRLLMKKHTIFNKSQNYVLITFFIIFLNSPLFSQEFNYEQIALQYFLGNFWNDKLFEKECTGLSFNENFSINVYDTSFQEIPCVVYSEFIFGISRDSMKGKEI